MENSQKIRVTHKGQTYLLGPDMKIFRLNLENGNVTPAEIIEVRKKTRKKVLGIPYGPEFEIGDVIARRLNEDQIYVYITAVSLESAKKRLRFLLKKELKAGEISIN